MMRLSVKNIFKTFFYVEPHERLKVVLLSLSFFCIIGTYTVVRTLKDSIFTSLVGGRESLAVAKLWSMILLIPAILIFSKLVDVLRRAHLMMIYAFIYGVGGLVIGSYLSDPVIGLPNTIQSPDRIFGWVVYFFFEGFNPFVVSLFWSFSHSITSPTAAKGNYPIMVAASKLGGIVSTALAVWWLMRTDGSGMSLATDTYNHQVLFYAASLLVLLVPVLMYIMLVWVPGRYLHGYEAVYKFERKHDELERVAAAPHRGFIHAIKRNFDGLIMLVRYPYVMGLFGVVFFWELINVFINFERVAAASEAALSMSHKTALLLSQDFWVHTVGLFVTLIGTRAIIEILGERKALLLVPTVTGVLLVYYLVAQTLTTSAAATSIGVAYILLKALNYAFAAPLRESLYIPTTKSVKFKSKSWIDSFGTKFAKSLGATYVGFSGNLLIVSKFFADCWFFAGIIGLWMVVAHLLGRRYELAVLRNEVIGTED